MLLKTFRSVKNIKQTPAEKLVPLIGSARAQLIDAYFKNQEKDQ
jgi:hypothetical protein